MITLVNYKIIKNKSEGAAQTDFGVSYAIKKRGLNTFDMISSQDVQKKWPTQLLEFLEGRISFVMPPRTVQFLLEVEMNQSNGQPSNILGEIFFFILLFHN